MFNRQAHSGRAHPGGLIASAVTRRDRSVGDRSAHADPSSPLVDAGPNGPDHRHHRVLPAMKSDVPLTVISPGPVRRAVCSSPNGAGGGEDTANWLNKTDIEEFTANKNVYVVVPNRVRSATTPTGRSPTRTSGCVSGRPSGQGITLGHRCHFYNTNGRNAIGGIRPRPPGAQPVDGTQGPAGRRLQRMRADLGPRPGAGVRGWWWKRVARAMRPTWGPYNGPGWKANDPVLHAAGLRGMPLYISSGGGIPGKYDNPHYVTKTKTLADQIVIGGVLEGGSMYCTQNLLRRPQNCGSRDGRPAADRIAFLALLAGPAPPLVVVLRAPSALNPLHRELLADTVRRGAPVILPVHPPRTVLGGSARYTVEVRARSRAIAAGISATSWPNTQVVAPLAST